MSPILSSLRSLAVHALPVLLPLAIVSCNGKKNDDRTEKNLTPPAPARSGWGLDAYPLEERDPKGFTLPSQLREISGMTFTADGRLFAHGDERGAVYQIDTATGEIIKKFTLGKKGVKEDFEDIASVDDRFYMVTSGGKIYEFPEGENEGEVEFSIHTTPLTTANDIEGLCFDPATNSLLLACKGRASVEESAAGGEGKKGIYSFSLATKQFDPTPRFLISLGDLTHGTKETEFNPSAITRNPKTGTFFLMTSANRAIAEIAADGKVLLTRPLRKGAHQQPEGIAFSPDMRLFISDEGGDGDARVSIYEK